jgi:hypothetical protein
MGFIFFLMELPFWGSYRSGETLRQSETIVRLGRYQLIIEKKFSLAGGMSPAFEKGKGAEIWGVFGV